jgi:Sulfotransferase domain
MHNGTAQKMTAVYDPSIVQRAVHLVRNPFDNIVARFHMKINNWRAKEYHKESINSNLYNSTKEGFQAYCHFRDKPFAKLKWNATNIFGEDTTIQKQLLGYLYHVPCYEQFLNYIRWHNFALEMLEKKKVPVLTLFYEDYASNFEGTVTQLLDFLSLEPANGASPPEFVAGKQYLDFYEPDQVEAARNLMRRLANQGFRQLLLRYLA